MAGGSAFAAVATVLALASPAYAYSNPVGAGSGSCTPASQDAVAVGSQAGAVTCTFTFTNGAGHAVTGSHPFTYSGSGYSTTSGPRQTVDGAATVTVPRLTCSAPGAKSETVTVTLNDEAAGANATAQAFSTVDCVKRTSVVEGAGCFPTNSMFTGYDAKTCSWQTDAPNGTGVSFPPLASGFTFGGSSSVAGGGFGTTVYVPSGSVAGVVVTGVVANSANAEGSSASQNTNNPGVD